MNKRQIVIEIICFLFIVLFVYAGVTKLMEVEKFRIQIGQSPLLSPFADGVAWGIPILEIVVSIFLAIPRLREIALYASFTIMTMFTFYIIAILNFGTYIPCSCVGILEKLGWTEHLIFNIAFTLLALTAIVLISKTSAKNKVIA